MTIIRKFRNVPKKAFAALVLIGLAFGSTGCIGAQQKTANAGKALNIMAAPPVSGAVLTSAKIQLYRAPGANPGLYTYSLALRPNGQGQWTGAFILPHDLCKSMNWQASSVTLYANWNRGIDRPTLIPVGTGWNCVGQG